MTPDVVVDVGNSRIKWGRVADSRVAEMASLAPDDPAGWTRQAEAWGLPPAARWAVASVNPPAAGRLGGWLAGRGTEPAVVTHAVFAAGGPLGFRTAVAQPERTGIDRLLTAFAGWRRAGGPAVAVSVGTAMTVDLVEPGGRHVGGVILPGPHLMARSLHDHTAALPLFRPTAVLPERGWGGTTRAAIEAGIGLAAVCTADEVVSQWFDQHDEPPAVFVTGGGAGYFDGFLFTATGAEAEIDPLLTLDGLRLAAEALP